MIIFSFGFLLTRDCAGIHAGQFRRRLSSTLLDALHAGERESSFVFAARNETCFPASG